MNTIKSFIKFLKEEKWLVGILFILVLCIQYVRYSTSQDFKKLNNTLIELKDCVKITKLEKTLLTTIVEYRSSTNLVIKDEFIGDRTISCNKK